MKKLFLSQLLIVVCFVPLGHAGSQGYCMHLTNFCDTLELQKSGELAYGGWDWQCEFDWTSTPLLGNLIGDRELAARPAGDGGDRDVLGAYSAEFYFRSGNVFDLYGTGGIQTGVFSFQTGQPYTMTRGECRVDDVDRHKPRLMSTVEATPPEKAGDRSDLRCLHFKNYCDTIVFSTAKESPWTLLYGNWDWTCQGDWVDYNIIGNAKNKPEMTTRPGLSYQYISPYTSEFSFKAGKLFDLYETAGTGQGVFTTRTNEPFTVTNGTCNGRDINATKPRLMDR